MSSKSTGLKRRESLRIVYHIEGLKKEKSHGHINRHRKSIWQNPAPINDKNYSIKNRMKPQWDKRHL